MELCPLKSRSPLSCVMIEMSSWRKDPFACRQHFSFSSYQVSFDTSITLFSNSHFSLSDRLIQLQNIYWFMYCWKTPDAASAVKIGIAPLTFFWLMTSRISCITIDKCDVWEKVSTETKSTWRRKLLKVEISRLQLKWKINCEGNF